MSNINKQALRQKAMKAGGDEWQARQVGSDYRVIRGGSFEKAYGIISYRDIAKIEYKPIRDFVAAANPATVLALLDELEASERRNVELTDALKQTVSGYKSSLRTGHERILDLGGDCDAPEVMIAGNPDIQLAEKLIASGTAKGE